MKNREKLIKTLTNLFTAKSKECMAIYTTELVNAGRLTMFNLQQIMTGHLENCNDVVLVWLYEPLGKNGIKVPDISEFFSVEEIREAHTLVTKQEQSKLPLKFKILAKLREDSYLICQSVQQIMALKEGGLIRWKENMQRETVITKVGDDNFVSHIRFDADRAIEIGKCMAAGNFFPNALRWHIVTNDCEYEISDDTFTLKSGYIAEIDGQHRNKGSEYALKENADIDLKMPVIITIGSPSVAQRIINQDEQRAPIERNVVESYKVTPGNNIVKKISSSEELDDCYKFCSTKQAVVVGSGFVLKSSLARAIDKYYFNNKSVSKNEELKIYNWLLMFFNELADILHEDFANYQIVRMKSNTVNDDMFPAYVYISHSIMGIENWESILKQMIAKINFSKEIKIEKTANPQNIEPIIKELLKCITKK